VNGDDERDYAEEAANQREMEREQASEAATAEAPYVVVRTQNAGAWAGVLGNWNMGARVVNIQDARLIQSWVTDNPGALSELAANGTSEPWDWTLAPAVPEANLHEVVALLVCSPKGRKAIEAI
jgi:hypothetical protein